MNSKVKIIALNIFILLFFYCNYALAGTLDTMKLGQEMRQEEAFLKTSGFSTNTSVSGIIAMVIKGFLSVLGIIFVVLIIVAGYNWMTASGNEEKVEKAKDTIKRAIIGLIITASAYAITAFVFGNL